MGTHRRRHVMSGLSGLTRIRGRWAALAGAAVLVAAFAVAALTMRGGPGVATTAAQQSSQPTVAQGSWPQYGLGPAETFDNTAETQVSAANVSRLEPVWLAGGNENGTFSPVEADGIVYAPCSSDNLCAYSASTGHILWQVSIHPGFSPAVAGGLVFTTCPDQANNLCAYNATGGQLVWTAVLNDGQVTSAPAVVGGVVYVGGQNGYLYAISASTGQVLWQFSASNQSNQLDPVYSTPAVVNGVVYVHTDDGSLLAISASSHNLLWQGYDPDVEYGGGTPNVADGLVVVDGGRPAEASGTDLWALPAGGCGNSVCRPVWVTNVGDGGVTGTAVAGGVVYATGGAGMLTALDLRTGKILWTSMIGENAPSSNPMVAGGVVYVGTSTGQVAAFAAAGCGKAVCRQLWSSQIGTSSDQEAQPIMVDGTLFATSSDGLYAFQIPGAGQSQPAAPASPTNVRATLRSPALANATWTPPAAGSFPITSYTIIPSPGNVPDAYQVAGASSGNINNLGPGQSYTFTVVATSAAGSSPPSAPSNAVTPPGTATAPGAPVIGTATAGNASAMLNFTQPSSDGGAGITRFTVTATDHTNPADSTQMTTTAYGPVTVPGLTDGDSYTFTVTATNAAGTGPASAPSNAVTPEAPDLTGAITGYGGKCVDDYRSSASNGTKVDLYSCNGTNAQQWTLTSSGELVTSNGMCVNDAGYGGAGSKVILWSCTGTSNEVWTYWPKYQEYSVSYGGHTYCMNDPGYSTTPGVQQIVWTCPDTANEQYTLPY